MKKYLLILMSIAFLSSCEEKMVTIPEVKLPTGDKTVLVEDLTGVRCTNCPTGASKLESLQETLYGDRLITISVHGNSLTDPIEAEDYNLNNADADIIDDYLKPYIGKPAISIDRRQYIPNYFSITGIDSWAGHILKAFEEEVLVRLTASSTYDDVSRLVTMDITVTPQVAELDTNNIQISVMLVESGIETTQKGPQDEIEEYEHHNVLRKVITNTTGEDMDVSSEQYVPTSASFSYTLPAEDGGWVAENMKLVAFVAKGTTKEVLQTIIIPVIE